MNCNWFLPFYSSLWTMGIKDMIWEHESASQWTVNLHSYLRSFMVSLRYMKSLCRETWPFPKKSLAKIPPRRSCGGPVSYFWFIIPRSLSHKDSIINQVFIYTFIILLTQDSMSSLRYSATFYILKTRGYQYQNW